MKTIVFLLAFTPLLLHAQISQLNADVLGTSDTTDGGSLQLATPSLDHFLRFNSGQQNDPRALLYFSKDDTLSIMSGTKDYLDMRKNISIYNALSAGLPTTFVGINTSQPMRELDIRSNDLNDGSEINIGNLGNDHFLRLFSGRETLFTFPAIYWKDGDSLSMGTNANGYTELFRLSSDGTMFLNSEKGVVLDIADKPLITRGWNPFTSGPYKGIGRWGIFMEPNYLTFGAPDIGSRGFQFVTYQEDGSIADTLLRIKDGNVGLNNIDPQHLLDVKGDANFTNQILLNGSAGTSGQVLTSNGSGDPSWETVSTNPQVGFKAKLTSTQLIMDSIDTQLTLFTEDFDDGNNFTPGTGIFTVPSDGVYHFDFHTSWIATSSSYNDVLIGLTITKNGSDHESLRYRTSIDAVFDHSVFYSTSLRLSTGDQIAFNAIHYNVVPLNLSGGGSLFDSRVSGYKVY